MESMKLLITEPKYLQIDCGDQEQGVTYCKAGIYIESNWENPLNITRISIGRPTTHGNVWQSFSSKKPIVIGIGFVLVLLISLRQHILFVTCRHEVKKHSTPLMMHGYKLIMIILKILLRFYW